MGEDSLDGGRGSEIKKALRGKNGYCLRSSETAEGRVLFHQGPRRSRSHIELGLLEYEFILTKRRNILSVRRKEFAKDYPY